MGHVFLRAPSGILVPQLADEFVRADAGTIGGAWSTMAGTIGIASNAVQPQGVGATDDFGRYDVDLASVDQWASLRLARWAGITDYAAIGPMVRQDAAANSGYAFVQTYVASPTNAEEWKLQLWNAGALTDLLVLARTGAVGDVFTIEAIGNFLRGVINGTEAARLVDTTFPSNLRAGVTGYRQLSGVDVAGNQWRAGAFRQVPVFTHRAGAGSATDATTYATASLTPAAGSLVLCAIVHQHGTAIPKQADTVTGASISGAVFIGKIGFNTVATNRSTLEIWAAIGTGSAGAITFTYSGGTSQTQIGAEWAITEVTNIDTARGTNGVIQFATGRGDAQTAAALSSPLAAFGQPYNPVFTVVGVDTATTVTPDAGFVELFDGSHATPNEALQTQYSPWARTNPAAALSSSDYGFLALELAGRITGGALEAIPSPQFAVQRAASW